MALLNSLHFGLIAHARLHPVEGDAGIQVEDRHPRLSRAADILEQRVAEPVGDDDGQPVQELQGDGLCGDVAHGHLAHQPGESFSPGSVK